MCMENKEATVQKILSDEEKEKEIMKAVKLILKLEPDLKKIKAMLPDIREIKKVIPDFKMINSMLEDHSRRIDKEEEERKSENEDIVSNYKERFEDVKKIIKGVRGELRGFYIFIALAVIGFIVKTFIGG